MRTPQSTLNRDGIVTISSASSSSKKRLVRWRPIDGGYALYPLLLASYELVSREEYGHSRVFQLTLEVCVRSLSQRSPIDHVHRFSLTLRLITVTHETVTQKSLSLCSHLDHHQLQLPRRCRARCKLLLHRHPAMTSSRDPTRSTRTSRQRVKRRRRARRSWSRLTEDEVDMVMTTTTSWRQSRSTSISARGPQSDRPFRRRPHQRPPQQLLRCRWSRG